MTTPASVAATEGPKLIELLDAIAPDFAELTNDFAFGHIYSRRVLPAKDAQLLRVAAIAANRGTPSALRVHMEGAFKHDGGLKEITEGSSKSPRKLVSCGQSPSWRRSTTTSPAMAHVTLKAVGRPSSRS